MALVPRLALKTRFSEMGWGSTPPSSAKSCLVSLMVELRFYTADTAVRFCHEVPNNARIAQSVEQRIENPRVGGSIPSPGTS